MMNYLYLKAFIFATLTFELLLCEPDLFDLTNKKCEESILSRKEHSDATWNKIIRVHERKLRQCRKLCGNEQEIKQQCYRHEPDFVEGIGFKLQSDKCCDSKACKCICSYKCSTMKTKKKALQVSTKSQYIF